MKLKQLKVHNFGKLNNREMQFEDGVNIVYGPNESGKTTLHEFIKGMFYGITRQRGRASRNDIYTRYEPWDNSSYFAGELRFESGEKDFKIARNFYKNDTKEELICETDGERLSIEYGDMEALIGDVSESVFDNTISVGQMRSRTDESLYQELRNYMTNYEASGDWELDVQQALNSLKQQKKEFDGQQRLESSQKETKKKELQVNVNYIQSEIEQYEARIVLIEEEIKSKKEENARIITEANSNQGEEVSGKEEVSMEARAKEDASKDKEDIKSKQSVFNRIRFLSPILLVIAIETFFFDILPVQVRIVAAVVGILATILWWVSSRNDGEAISKGQAEEPIEEATDKVANAPTETPLIEGEGIELIEGKLAQLKEMQEEKKIQLENCQADYWEYSANTGEKSEAEGESEAVQLAMDSISEVSAAGTHRMEKEFHQRISDILKEITNGKYDKVILDDKAEISLYSDGKIIPLWTLSKGTIEQVYFALRMAAAELFCNEDMPILLDDVFVMYDEDRLAAVLSWLAKNKQQVIIFTCNTREVELANKLRLDINIVNLENVKAS